MHGVPKKVKRVAVAPFGSSTHLHERDHADRMSAAGGADHGLVPDPFSASGGCAAG